VQYTKEAAADRTAIESFAERAKKEKELATSKLHGTRRTRAATMIAPKRCTIRLWAGACQGRHR
jgi:hypothetical protein